MSFARTQSRDGKWNAGDVIRRNTFHHSQGLRQSSAFPDTVILGFNDEGCVRVRRPAPSQAKRALRLRSDQRRDR
jgi:hypothetical protein